MGIFQRPIDRQPRAVDRFDRALLCEHFSVSMARPTGSRFVFIVTGRRDDNPIADAPAGDRFVERDFLVVRRRVFAELHPGVVQRCAVKIHPPAAADDGRTRLPVHAVEIREPDDGGMLGRDRPIRRTDFQRRRCLFDVGGLEMRVAIKALFAIFVAGFDLDQPNVEPRVAIGGEAESAGDIDAANRVRRFHVVNNPISGPNHHPRPAPGTWPPSQVPRSDQ